MADEAATAKDKRFRLVSLLPDVCKTPGKKGKPIPYPITHSMDQSAQCSPNVFFRGEPAFLHNESYVDKVKGDEPGGGKGIVSKTHVKVSHSIDKSRSVYVNGKPIVRTGDMMWMNYKKPGDDGGEAAPAPKDSSSGSGLGSSVDDLIDKSPTLKKDLEQLKKDGWEIEYGAPGQGSAANRLSDPKKIVLDGNLKGRPNETVQVLSHEVGHATFPYKADLSTREAYLAGTLGDEGAATMKNIQVQREILANSGGKVDIGIAGNPANHAAYNQAYDRFLKDGNAAAARQAIGNVYRNGEYASGANVTYEQYYGRWYDKHYGKPK